MKIFVDCEWSDYRGDLLSMALVAEDGREWYRELPVLECNAWVLQHVVPHLSRNHVDPRQFSAELGLFLRSLGAREVEIIVDWPEDIERFCASLIVGPGQRVSTPDLRFRIIDGNAAVSALPHHALHDARAIRDLFIARRISKESRLP